VARLKAEAQAHREAAARLRDSKLFQAGLFLPPPVVLNVPLRGRDQEQVDPRLQHGSYDCSATPPRAGSRLGGSRTSRRVGGTVVQRTEGACGGSAASDVVRVRDPLAAADSRHGGRATRPAPPADPVPVPVVAAMEERAESLRRRRAALQARQRQAERDAVVRLQREVDAHKALVAQARRGAEAPRTLPPSLPTRDRDRDRDRDATSCEPQMGSHGSTRTTSHAYSPSGGGRGGAGSDSEGSGSADSLSRPGPVARRTRSRRSPPAPGSLREAQAALQRALRDAGMLEQGMCVCHDGQSGRQQHGRA
jgi:hypothetical protein